LGTDIDHVTCQVAPAPGKVVKANEYAGLEKSLVKVRTSSATLLTAYP
jgi:hypothetical protein